MSDRHVRPSASVVLIGMQPEGPGMHPHLADILLNLRRRYEDVVYVVGDQGHGFDLDLSRIDRTMRRWVGKRGAAGPDVGVSVPLTVDDVVRCGQRMAAHLRQRFALPRALAGAPVRHATGIVIAIDLLNAHLAERVFEGPIVLWSFDVLTQDRQDEMRFEALRRLLTARLPVSTRHLVVQDPDRQRCLEATVGRTFDDAVHVTVGLEDAPFCRDAARARLERGPRRPSSVLQIGRIEAMRHSLGLIDAYQSWPPTLVLALRGFVEERVRQQARQVRRRPELDDDLVGRAELMERIDGHDYGFVGYGETHWNERYIAHASAQLVEFLRLGLPVVTCASRELGAFVEAEGAGRAVSNPAETASAIADLSSRYRDASAAARSLYEREFDLGATFDRVLGPWLDERLGPLRVRRAG